MSNKIGPFSELDIILNMIQASEKEGLTVEVVWSLVHSLAPGITPERLNIECREALYEWDI